MLAVVGPRFVHHAVFQPLRSVHLQKTQKSGFGVCPPAGRKRVHRPAEQGQQEIPHGVQPRVPCVKIDCRQECFERVRQNCRIAGAAVVENAPSEQQMLAQTDLFRIGCQRTLADRRRTEP